MNTYRLITSALVVAAMSSPLGFAAETSPGASDANQPYQRQAGDITIRRVTDDELKLDLTAKDFIGKAIYDPAGEKLGDILDLHLSNRMAGDAGRDMSRSDRAGAASDAARNASRSMGENVAYVSVGGLLGMGDSVVTVPLSALQFDAAKERFTLNVRKTDFVAIAKEEVPAYTSRNEAAPSYAGPSRPDTANASADEATKVKLALQKDQAVGKLSSRILVSEISGSIVLSGSVGSQNDKERIVNVARAATAKPVTDKITIATTP